MIGNSNSVNIKASVAAIGQAIKLSENAHFSRRKKLQRIELKTYESICYLTKGNVSFYRLEDDMLTISLNAPAILGLAQMRNETKSHYLRCDTDCEMWVIGTSDAITLFTGQQLWRHAFDILTIHQQLYFMRDHMQSHRSIRSIVLAHLQQIWQTDPQERAATSVYTYILLRNRLSRSAVHKVVQNLVQSGEVGIARGKLIWLKDAEDAEKENLKRVSQ